MDFKINNANLNKEYKKEYKNYRTTLDQFHYLFKKQPNYPLSNQQGYVDFRSPIPSSILSKFKSVANDLTEYSHKNVLHVIDSIFFFENAADNILSKALSLKQSINNLSMAIFFSPLPITKSRMEESLKSVKDCFEHLLEKIAQYSFIENEENPFISSILRLFTFTIILYGIVMKNQLDYFLAKTLNPQKTDNSRLVYFHSDTVFEYISQILRTPNQYSINFHSEINETKVKLDEMLRSMEDVFKDEFVARPIYQEITNEERGEQLRPICTTRVDFPTHSIDSKLDGRARSYYCDPMSTDFGHLDNVCAPEIGGKCPYGLTINNYSAAAKKFNRKFYVLQEERNNNNNNNNNNNRNKYSD